MKEQGEEEALCCPGPPPLMNVSEREMSNRKKHQLKKGPTYNKPGDTWTAMNWYSESTVRVPTPHPQTANRRPLPQCIGHSPSNLSDPRGRGQRSYSKNGGVRGTVERTKRKKKMRQKKDLLPDPFLPEYYHAEFLMSQVYYISTRKLKSTFYKSKITKRHETQDN